MYEVIRAFFSAIKDKAQELIIRIKCFLLGHDVVRSIRRERYQFRTNRKGKAKKKFRTNRKGKAKKRYYSYIHKCTTDYCQRCGKTLRRKWKWI